MKQRHQEYADHCQFTTQLQFFVSHEERFTNIKLFRMVCYDLLTVIQLGLRKILKHECERKREKKKRSRI